MKGNLFWKLYENYAVDLLDEIIKIGHMKTEHYTCDIGNCNNEAALKSFELQVIFTTEQNEGRGTEPYLSTVKIDLCKGCYEQIVSGNYVFATGAMGHNEYSFNWEKKGRASNQ